MMLDMLPQDLAFTVLVPSEDAFKRDLRLSVNDSFKPDKFNDTYAIVSRILGFSAVPGTLSLANVQLGELVNYDSSSGFPLYFSKDINGMLVKEILVHVMDGVIMDAEFEESILAEDDTEED
uniref:FAS1 domain-containing protein n=1 Tax=Glycine max TaxID=3847 RepID=I1JI61_SOYBN